MKPDSIVLAVAGMCFGVIVGWLLANLDADRTAASRQTAQVAQPTAAGNERQPPRLDEARPLGLRCFERRKGRIDENGLVVFLRVGEPPVPGLGGILEF